MATYTVKVKDFDGENKFQINYSRQAIIDAGAGEEVIFDQSDASNAGHPLRIALYQDGAHVLRGSEYTTGVTVSGTPGQAGAKTTLTVSNTSLHGTYFYYCKNHPGMGGMINYGNNDQLQKYRLIDQGAIASDGQDGDLTSSIKKTVQRYNDSTQAWDTLVYISDSHSNPWAVTKTDTRETAKYRIIYGVTDSAGLQAQSRVRLINITASSIQQLTPGEIGPAYANGAPENAPIPLHNHIMAFNWGALLSDASGSGNPWYAYGDGQYGGPPYNTWHEFLLRHPSSYFTQELWEFMRRPTLQVEVKACGPWADSHGSTTMTYRVNRFRLKDTSTGEYWNWGSKKNFDYGMANGEWSSFVPFGSGASLMSMSLDPNSSAYVDLREGINTIADGGGEPSFYSHTEQSGWVSLLFSTIMGGGVIGGNVAYGGTYISSTNTFQVSTPSMSNYMGQSAVTSYATMWNSSKAISSASALEGVPALDQSAYHSPAGFPHMMTSFYPNLTLYAVKGHAWVRGYLAYLAAGAYYAINEPPSPNLSEFFDEADTQYRYPGAYNLSAGVAPAKGVKSIKGSDPDLIVEHASSDHYDPHGVPMNYDFQTFTQGAVSTWLVPLTGTHWYVPDGSAHQVKQNAPSTYICGHVPPYFN